jgi:hypothetical protein
MKLKLSLIFLLIEMFYEFFANFEITRNLTQVDKICSANLNDRYDEPERGEVNGSQ